MGLLVGVCFPHATPGWMERFCHFFFSEHIVYLEELTSLESSQPPCIESSAFHSHHPHKFSLVVVVFSSSYGFEIWKDGWMWPQILIQTSNLRKIDKIWNKWRATSDVLSKTNVFLKNYNIKNNFKFTT